MTGLLTILFDGVAYGMLLFVLSCGLAVTLGLMNFVNLAHGAFAMAGGYICAVLVNQSGVPFFVINDAVALSGAQAPETFRAAFEQAAASAVGNTCEVDPATGEGNC